MRTLPPDLVKQLGAARRLEQLADGLGRKRDAITATGSLMLAAVEAGWTRTEIGRVLGMNHQTVAARVRTARELYGDATPALVVDAPLGPPPDPLAVLRRPVAEREWLGLREAAAFAGCHTYTIRNWRVGGLLPNTEHPSPKMYLFLRADLRRVMRAPRYKGQGVNYEALRAEIASAPA